MRIVNADYAGFWLRLCAFFVDSAILCVALMFCQFMFSIPMRVGVPVFPTPILMGFNFLSMIIVWIYYAAFESSKWQATCGKRLLKIKVTDMSGKRISFGRATGRHFAKILSSIIFFIGYIMILFTKKQQGLHDIIAETLVVRD